MSDFMAENHSDESKAIAVVGQDLIPAVSYSTGIVPFGKNSLIQRDKELERRRAARKQHYHDQVWTKDPHGGPYRKVRFKTAVLSAIY